MNTPSNPDHWDTSYRLGDTERGWYQQAAQVSLRLLKEFETPLDAHILDVGAGASVFVDDVIDAGFTNITVLDHSREGLAIARERLGTRAMNVEWVVGDLLDWNPRTTFAVWHDRAVLHFLIDPADQNRYLLTMKAATHPGSLIIIGVFSERGPTMCAGLPVVRYRNEDIESLLGSDFIILSQSEQQHVRPDGDTQSYLWTVARRIR
jgi:SAM-dependent methyltransferase